MPNPLATPTPTRTVLAGPLSAEYEQGELRYVRFRGREVLRRIYIAVRDQNWHTIPIRVQETTFESTADSFRIQLNARHELDGIAFAWRGRIVGAADGSIRVEIDGEPETEFLRNRIGICTLHPVDTCAGLECAIEHTDGTRETSRFPDLVAPHQPFLNLRALSYPVAPGVRAELRFLGDEFETEDQRNWSDYTFKTYSTRLSIPVPVRVKPGDRVQQSVELKLTGNEAAPGAARPAKVPVEIRIHPETAKLPKVGIVYDSRIPAVGAHVRFDVAFANPKWRERLSEAATWRHPLELACLSNNPEVDFPQLASELKILGATVVRFLPFPESALLTDPRSIPIAREAFGPRAVITAGSRKHFADLNRNRDIVSAADEVVWSVDPYAHAADYRTVVENLQGQMDPPKTARSFSGELPLVISAVRVPDIESRAGWIAASLKQLSQHGIASITYDLRTCHLREVAVVEFAQFLGDEIVHSTSSDPLTVEALLIKKGTDQGSVSTAFLANFSATSVDVQIANQLVDVPGLGIRQVNL
jgi:D-apionolactonase